MVPRQYCCRRLLFQNKAYKTIIFLLHNDHCSGKARKFFIYWKIFWVQLSFFVCLKFKMSGGEKNRRKMALKNYDKLNSISEGRERKYFLMAPHQKTPNTPSFTVLLGIEISLSVLKGNYIENLCHNIITDTRIISLAIYTILRVSLVVFNVFSSLLKYRKQVINLLHCTRWLWDDILTVLIVYPISAMEII